MPCTAPEDVRLFSTGSSVYVTAAEKRNSTDTSLKGCATRINPRKGRHVVHDLPTPHCMPDIAKRCAGQA